MNKARLPLMIELLGWLAIIGGAAAWAWAAGVVAFGVMLVVAANSAGGAR